MTPILWMGFNWFNATEPLQGDSFHFTTKSPEGPGGSTLEGWKVDSTLEPPSGIEPGTPWPWLNS